MISSTFRNISETLKNLKGLFPKKSVQSDYIQILKLACNMVNAEIVDFFANCKKHKLKIDYNKLLHFYEKRYEFHITSQVNMYSKR